MKVISHINAVLFVFHLNVCTILYIKLLLKRESDLIFLGILEFILFQIDFPGTVSQNSWVASTFLIDFIDNAPLHSVQRVFQLRPDIQLPLGPEIAQLLLLSAYCVLKSP